MTCVVLICGTVRLLKAGTAPMGPFLFVLVVVAGLIKARRRATVGHPDHPPEWHPACSGRHVRRAP